MRDSTMPLVPDWTDGWKHSNFIALAFGPWQRRGERGSSCPKMKMKALPFSFPLKISPLLIWEGYEVESVIGRLGLLYKSIVSHPRAAKTMQFVNEIQSTLPPRHGL